MPWIVILIIQTLCRSVELAYDGSPRFSPSEAGATVVSGQVVKHILGFEGRAAPDQIRRKLIT